MKAIAIEEFGGIEKLQLMNLEVPRSGDDELLVHVRAAGVNPVDWKIREGRLAKMFPHRFPLILGWDAAGVVVKAGANVNRFSAGDPVFVYCRKPEVHDGAYAEFIAVSHHHVAKMPANLAFKEAASVPLAALTAMQALYDKGAVDVDETVLIHAAAGGVGGFAVQLAKLRGATVVGTARARNHSYVKKLGADSVIDYSEQDFREAVKAEYPEGVNLVLDCVGGETLAKSAEVLKGNGRIVSIVRSPELEQLAKQGVNVQHVFVEPNGEQLEQLRVLIEDGKLRTHVSAVFPLEEAAQAHEMIQSGHTRGKLVLTIGSASDDEELSS